MLFRSEIKALEADRGEYLGYVRVVGRRRAQANLSDLIVSLPAQYTRKTLLKKEQDRRAPNSEPLLSPDGQQQKELRNGNF